MSQIIPVRVGEGGDYKKDREWLKCGQWAGGGERWAVSGGL